MLHIYICMYDISRLRVKIANKFFENFHLFGKGCIKLKYICEDMKSRFMHGRLLVCVLPLQLLKQLTDLHEISYESYAI